MAFKSRRVGERPTNNSSWSPSPHDAPAGRVVVRVFGGENVDERVLQELPKGNVVVEADG